MRTKEEILDGMNEIEFLLRCQIDFKFFCERMLNITEYGGIHKFQLDWFNMIQNNYATIIEAPSGYSKTEIVGVAYTLWFMLVYPKTSILLISRTLAQAKDNLLERIKGYITDNEFLSEWIPKDANKTWNSKQIKTTTGVSVVNVPYNPNIRGYRAHLIVLDEIDSYDDTELFFDDVITRLHPGGKLVGISTPVSSTRIIGILKVRKPKGYIFHKTVGIVDEKGKPKSSDYDNGISIWPERFSVQWLLDTRQEIGDINWQRNYMCNTNVEGRDSVYTINSILSCYDISLKFDKRVRRDSQYFIGVAWAVSKGSKADFDAYVVVERTNDGKIIIKDIQIYKGIPYPKRLERLQEIYDTYQSDKTTKLVVDAGMLGVGAIINDLRGMGMTVIPQDFHSAERKKLLLTLANVIESGNLVIPRWSRDKQTIDMTNLLVEQLLGFERVKKEGSESDGRIVSKARHDDVAVSVAMAVKEAARMRTIMSVGVSCS